MPSIKARLDQLSEKFLGKATERVRPCYYVTVASL